MSTGAECIGNDGTFFDYDSDEDDWYGDAPDLDDKGEDE